MNLAKNETLTQPQILVRVTGEDGSILIDNAPIGCIISTNTEVPEWKEIGTILNSGNNTSLTIELSSIGSILPGNDFAIDDVELREAQDTAICS